MDQENTEIHMTSRWGVEIEGDEEDITQLCLKINGSITSRQSHFVTTLDGIDVFRSNQWDMVSKDDIEERAKADLDKLVGAANLLDSCSQMQIGTIFEFTPEGIVYQFRSGSIECRIRPSLDGYESPQRFWNVVQVANKRPFIAEALSHFFEPFTWPKIYMIFEALKKDCGDEPAFLRSYPLYALNLKRIRRTSNSYRHIGGNQAPIANPISISESVETLHKILTAAVSHHFKGNMPTVVATMENGTGAGKRHGLGKFLFRNSQGMEEFDGRVGEPLRWKVSLRPHRLDPIFKFKPNTMIDYVLKTKKISHQDQGNLTFFKADFIDI